MKYMLTQNSESFFYKTFEEAQAAVQYPDAEIWERIDFTDNYIKIWPHR